MPLTGESSEVSLALMYFPEESYDEVTPGATFTIREGPLNCGLRCRPVQFATIQEKMTRLSDDVDRLSSRLRFYRRCSKTVVVLCSEPIRLDQNRTNQVAGKWLKNQVE